jgi:hypothetical protein
MSRIAFARTVTLLSLPTLLIGALGCASAVKKPTPPDPEKAIQALVEGCKPIPNKPEWMCSEDAYLLVGDTVIKQKHAIARAEEELNYLRQDCDLDRQLCQAKLDQWWRKWYIVLPLGVLLGLLTGGAIYLFTGDAGDGQELPGENHPHGTAGPGQEQSKHVGGQEAVSG